MPHPRRTLWSLAVAGAMLIAVPAPSYAQDISSSLITPPFVIQQASTDDGPADGDITGGTAQGVSGGGVVMTDRLMFLRSAVSDHATDMEAARLALERTDDPAVKQFAVLVERQSRMMMQEAADVAARNGIEAPQMPTAADETDLIADLSNRWGKDFDETYLRAFIQDHRVAIADYLATRSGMSDDAATYADHHLGMLWEQIRMAEELAMRLGVQVEMR